MGRSIVVPVRRVASTARRLAGGDRAARVRGAEQARGELGAMARSFNEMAESLEASHDELGRRPRAVLDAAPGPIALLDDGGHAVVANEPMRLCLPLLRERPVPEVDAGVVRDEIRDPAHGPPLRALRRASR
jgi:HAMP domain-containing protein